MQNQRDEEPAPLHRVVPHTEVHRLTRRALESTQDVIVVALGIILFALMARTLWRLGQDVVAPELDFRTVISEVLFMLVMIELVRLLVIYLREHHVAVDVMVELGIVSTLREVVLRGVVELDWQEVVALAVFLLALGVLLRFGDLRLRLAVPGGDHREQPATPAAQLVSPQAQRVTGAR
jgi:uncharacterized membrane protein (DUF373 family)